MPFSYSNVSSAMNVCLWVVENGINFILAFNPVYVTFLQLAFMFAMKIKLLISYDHNVCSINHCRNAYRTNILLLLLPSIVTRQLFIIQHLCYYRTKL